MGLESEDPDLDASFDEERADSLERALADTAGPSAPPLPSLPPGTRIADRYVLEARLGRGGMGEVWAARDATTGTPVALKLLSMGTPDALARFSAEAQHAMALASPRTVRVLDHGTHDDRPFLVMERVHGQSLSAVLRDEGALDWRRAASVAAQILEALAEAHEHPLRIVHRDIKPDNVMVGEGDAVTVLDFGIARALEGGRTTLTRTGHMVGSPLAMAPEQWELRPVTPQTDLYALGCTVYHMLTGGPPFRAPDLAALGYMHVHDEAPAVDASIAPTALRRWTARLLAKRPGDRPASAREARAELLRVLDPPTRPEVDPATLPDRPYRHLRPFGRDTSSLFFGRERLVGLLRDAVVGTDAVPITLVFGATGVGKSSVLDAGLVPALAPTHEVRYARRDPSSGLAGTLRQMLGGDVSASRWRASEEERPLVLILDQVEEGLLAGSDELEQLVESLTAAFGDADQRPAGGLVLGFRKEWLDEVETILTRVALPFRKVSVPPLGRFDLIDAIEGPSRDPRLARHFRYEIEDGLAERVVATLWTDHRSSVAPTLQVLMTKLWDAATPGADGRRRLTIADFEALLSAGILLDDFLDEALARLERWRPGVSSSGLALDLLARHTTPAGTARSVPRGALAAAYGDRADEVGDLAAACIDASLLAGRVSVATRLSHDTLAPVVRRRFERSDRPGQRATRVLESRAAEWSRGVTVPLDTHDLRTVREGAPGMRALTEVERALLDRSEKEAAGRVRSRRRLTVLGAFLVALIALSAVVAWSQRQTALRAEASEREARLDEQAALHRSRTENLVSAVGRAQSEDRRRAALLALAAFARHRENPVGPEIAAEIGYRLRQALAPDHLPLEIRGYDDNVMAIDFAPDGARFAAAGGRSVGIFDLDGNRLQTLRGHEVLATGVCWAGPALYSLDEAGELLEWAPAHATPLRSRAQVGHGCFDLACGPAGWVAAGCRDGLHLRAPGTGALETVPGPVAAVAFASDGRLFAVRGADVLVLRRASDRWTSSRVVEWPGQILRELDVLPDGSQVLVGSLAGGVAVSRTEAGAAMRSLGSPFESVTALSFIDEGRRAVASGTGTDNAMSIYDLRGGRPPTSFEIGARAEDIRSDPTGRTFVVAEHRDMLQLFDRRHRDPDRLDAGHGDLTRITVDEAGERVLSYSRNVVVRLWTPAAGAAPIRLRFLGLPPRVSPGATPAIRRFVDGILTDLAARDWATFAARVDRGYVGEAGMAVLRQRFDGLAGLPNLTLFDLDAAPSSERAAAVVLIDGERAQRISLGLTPGAPLRVRALTVEPAKVIPLEGAFSGDGRRVGLATTDGVYVWDLERPDVPLAVLRVPGGVGFHRAVDFDPRDPTGERVSVLTAGGGLATWERPRGFEPAPASVRPRAVAGKPWGLHYTRDGARLVVGGTAGVVVLDGPDDPDPRVLTTAPTTAIAVSQGGLVATATGQERVAIFDLERPDAAPRDLVGHRGAVRGVAFSPDGTRLASASPRGEAVLVWAVDPPGDGPLEIIRHADGLPMDAGMLAGGQVVVSGVNGWVRTVRPLEAVAADLCARVGRDLTREEWRSALGEEPYRATCSP